MSVVAIFLFWASSSDVAMSVSLEICVGMEGMVMARRAWYRNAGTGESSDTLGGGIVFRNGCVSGNLEYLYFDWW